MNNKRKESNFYLRETGWLGYTEVFTFVPVSAERITRDKTRKRSVEVNWIYGSFQKCHLVITPYSILTWFYLANIQQEVLYA